MRNCPSRRSLWPGNRPKIPCVKAGLRVRFFFVTKGVTQRTPWLNGWQPICATLSAMRGLAIILAATVTTLLAALPAPAIPAREMDPIAREFAYCVGRLSATMEHQWLLSDPASDLTERQRGAMISLLETVSPPDQGARADDPSTFGKIRPCRSVAPRRVRTGPGARRNYTEVRRKSAWSMSLSHPDLAPNRISHVYTNFLPDSQNAPNLNVTLR